MKLMAGAGGFMESSSRGDLAVRQFEAAERERRQALTEENAQRDDRLVQVEAAVEELRAEVDALKGSVRALARELL